MGSRFNIPAPPKFNLRGRKNGEWQGDECPCPARGRGGYGRSGSFKVFAEKKRSEY
jgi:hypothetical protein